MLSVAMLRMHEFIPRASHPLVLPIAQVIASEDAIWCLPIALCVALASFLFAWGPPSAISGIIIATYNPRSIVRLCSELVSLAAAFLTAVGLLARVWCQGVGFVCGRPAPVVPAYIGHAWERGQSGRVSKGELPSVFGVFHFSSAQTAVSESVMGLWPPSC